MPKRKPRDLTAEARRRNLEQLVALGRDLREWRRRRRLTQQQLGERCGVSRVTISDIENGRGGGHTLDAWQRLGLVVGQPLIVRLQRDPLEDVADAGHLAIQELVLRLGRQAGFRGTFELPTRSREPWRSIDVGLRDDARRIVIVCECWNSFGDIGASVRSTMRKIDEAASIAAAVWGNSPHSVVGCWIVRETRRNRHLVARYPELFRSRFAGSSVAWLRALVDGDSPPGQLGLVWCDMAATRLFAWRQRPGPVHTATRIRG